jgi:hypothetical protein
MFVSHEFLDITPKNCFSVYKLQNFLKVKSFLPSIISEDQVKVLEQRVLEFQDDDDNDVISCKEFGIESMFLDIDHYILNKFITHHFKNVRWVLPSYEFHYAFVLQDIPSFENAVSVINNVYQMFDVALSDFSTVRNHLCITLCMGQYTLNIEILMGVFMPMYSLKKMASTLGFTAEKIEQYIEHFVEISEKKQYRYNGTCIDDIDAECSIENFQDLYEQLIDETE